MYIVTQDLDRFFAFIGERIATNAINLDNKQILWMTLEVSKFVALSEKRDTLDVEFFYKTLSEPSLQSLSERKDTIGQFAQALNQEFKQNVLASSLPVQIQEKMSEFNYQPKKSTLSFWHINKAINFALLGFVLTLAYYGFYHSWWLGLTVLLGLPCVYFLNKGLKALNALQQKRTIQHSIKQASKQTQKTSPVTQQEPLEKLDFHQIDKNLTEHFIRLNNQIQTFYHIFPAKREADNLYMEQDVLRMNNEHLKRLVKEYKDRQVTQEEAKTVIKILDAMTLVVQNHIATLLWNNEKELNATYRYWINKAASENASELFTHQNK